MDEVVNSTNPTRLASLGNASSTYRTIMFFTNPEPYPNKNTPNGNKTPQLILNAPAITNAPNNVTVKKAKGDWLLANRQPLPLTLVGCTIKAILRPIKLPIKPKLAYRPSTKPSGITHCDASPNNDTVVCFSSAIDIAPTLNIETQAEDMNTAMQPKHK